MFCVRPLALFSPYAAAVHIGTLATQDALVNDFQVQLKVKDEEYVKALKQQAEDVDELLERMRTEFKELQVGCAPRGKPNETQLVVR